MNKNEKNEQKILQEAYDQVKKDADTIWQLILEDIKEQEPILNFQGQPAIYKNTIVLLQGKTATHKSRLAGSMASLIVSEGSNKNLLGFSKATSEEFIVIYADTERNLKHQLPVVLKQILKDAQIEVERLKEKFGILPLMNTARHLRTKIMGKHFSELRKRCEDENKTPVVIILDIISDLVADFNNVINSLELTDLINSAINQFDITFIVTLHENPGSTDKARGHLGTELSNKASTIFQMASTSKTEVFSLNMLKSRTTAKFCDVLLQFDKSINNLRIVSDSETVLEASDPDTLKLLKVLGRKYFKKMQRQELIVNIEAALKWKERKIEEKLKNIIDNGIEFETALGSTILTKTRGKTVEYEMNFLDLPGDNNTDVDN